MMHTTRHGKTTFHYNSDFSGDVLIDVAGTSVHEMLKVPMADLAKFMEDVRTKLTEQIANKILGSQEV